jgi:hypothetical protein
MIPRRRTGTARATPMFVLRFASVRLGMVTTSLDWPAEGMEVLEWKTSLMGRLHDDALHYYYCGENGRVRQSMLCWYVDRVGRMMGMPGTTIRLPSFVSKLRMPCESGSFGMPYSVRRPSVLQLCTQQYCRRPQSGAPCRKSKTNFGRETARFYFSGTAGPIRSVHGGPGQGDDAKCIRDVELRGDGSPLNGVLLGMCMTLDKFQPNGFNYIYKPGGTQQGDMCSWHKLVLVSLH